MQTQLNLELTGQIFNVQRFSTHDGPGIRTTVFLKGCPLLCFWCQNPESQPLQPVLLFNQDLCCGCGSCVLVCPSHASYVEAGKGNLDRSRCRVCGSCVSACGQNARALAGKETSVGELVKLLLKDRYVFEDSGGGVTISGGEPTMQWQFTLALLQACRYHYIHTAIETCGYCEWERLRKLADVCDYIFFDLKCIDSELHKQGTGVPNELILDNARHVVEMGANVHFRTPLIPGFNDRAEHILALRDFIVGTLGLPASCLELLRYNKLGEDKFLRLGSADRQPKLEPQSDEYLAYLNGLLTQ